MGKFDDKYLKNKWIFNNIKNICKKRIVHAPQI